MRVPLMLGFGVHLAVAALVTARPAPPPGHCLGRSSDDCAPPDGPPPTVWSCIARPVRTSYVAPVYPADGRRQGVHGIVVLEIRIDAWGTVDRVRLLRSVPMLDDAAVEAVRRWRYTRTCLNGRAVAVVMTVA